MSSKLKSTNRLPHALERDVSRELQSQEGLDISSLVVRRLDHGTVCLEGVLHVDSPADEIEAIVKQVAGVNAVLNHLVVQPESHE